MGQQGGHGRRIAWGLRAARLQHRLAAACIRTPQPEGGLPCCFLVGDAHIAARRNRQIEG